MSCATFKRSVVSALVLFGIAAVVSPAAADYTIYSDSFARSGGLDASSPDVAAGFGGGSSDATWVSSPNITTNGTRSIYGTPTNGGCASLPFTPQSGQVYTLSADINVTNTSSPEWMAIGFTGENGEKADVAFYGYTTLPRLWTMMRGQTSTYANNTFNNGQADGLGGGVAAGTATGNNTVSIVLDTNNAAWTATWLINGSVVRAAEAVAAQDVAYVAFGGSPTSAFVDNFTLTTDTVPEPSSMTLLLAGILGLLAYAWKKRR